MNKHITTSTHQDEAPPALRLTGRTIRTVVAMPDDVRSALPMSIQLHFEDGAVLSLHVNRPLVMVDSDGAIIHVPSEPTTAAIDTAIARGVDPAGREAP